MTPAGTSTMVERRALATALSAATPLVVLVAPVGAGASTLLRQWARGHDDVTWGSPGGIPEDPGAALILDDADDLSAEDWEQVRALCAANPRLLVRAAVHSRNAVPAELEADFVTSLLLNRQETAEYLSARESNLDPSVVHWRAGGLAAAMRTIADLRSDRPEIIRAGLARLRPGPLDPRDAILAVPEVLTPEVVRELGGREDFIADAERAGLGQWMADAWSPLFLLTAPVRAATLVTGDLDAKAPEVRGQAARVLLEQGAWFGALIEGAASGTLAVVDAALKGGGMPMLRAHGASIAVALRDVGLFELRHWPVTAMALALVFNARQERRVRAAELFGMALLGVGTAPAGSAERGLLRVIESAARRLLGVGDGGVKAAQAAAQIMAELPRDERESIDGLLADIHAHAGISLMYGGRHDEALEQFERASAVAHRPSLRLLALGGMAMTHAMTGELLAAQSWVDTAAKHPWPDSILNEYPGSMLRIAQAKVLLEHGELDEADRALDSVWQIIDTIEHWPVLAHLRATIEIARGDAEAGLERLQALRRRRGARMPRSQTRLLDLTESALALAAGDLTTARGFTSRAGDSALVALGVLRVELFAGQEERVLRVLGGISPDGPEARAHLAVLEALAWSRLDRGNDAAVAARRARTIADTYGLMTPFLLMSAAEREMFQVVVPSNAPALSQVQAPRLTQRELVILQELVDTANVNDIAQRLHVSANTVKTQRRTLYRKLGAASREEALAIASGYGLLSPSASSALR